MSINRRGIVYILENKSFPALIKIGRCNNLANRISQLSSNTCLPYPFTCAYWREVTDCNAVEQTLHNCLAEYRVARNREFFNIKPELARDALNSVIILGKSTPLTSDRPFSENSNYPIDNLSAKETIFSFFNAGIPLGELIYFSKTNHHSAMVVDDKLVELEKEIMTLDSATFLVAEETTKRHIELLNTARLWSYLGKSLVHYKSIRSNLSTTQL